MPELTRMEWVWFMDVYCEKSYPGDGLPYDLGAAYLLTCGIADAGQLKGHQQAVYAKFKGMRQVEQLALIYFVRLPSSDLDSFERPWESKVSRIMAKF